MIVTSQCLQEHPEYTKPFEEWSALPCSYHLCSSTQEKLSTALSHFAFLPANILVKNYSRQGLLWLSCWELNILVIMMQSSWIKHNSEENSELMICFTEKWQAEIWIQKEIHFSLPLDLRRELTRGVVHFTRVWYWVLTLVSNLTGYIQIHIIVVFKSIHCFCIHWDNHQLRNSKCCSSKPKWLDASFEVISFIYKDFVKSYFFAASNPALDSFCQPCNYFG